MTNQTNKTSTVEIKERDPQLAIGLRTFSPVQELPTLIPNTNKAIEQYLSSLGKRPSGMPFVAYYNMDMDNLDILIGFLSTESVPDQGNIKCVTIPGGASASITHVGSYEGLAGTHQILHEWMTAKGYEPLDGYYEFYIDDPADTPEDQLKTEIFTLLKPS